MTSEPASTASEAGSDAIVATCSENLDLEFFRRCFDGFPDPVLVIDAL